MKITRGLIAAFLIMQFTPALAVPSSLIVGGTRPVTVQLPSDTSIPAPLLIMLQSASTSGRHQERYMKLAPIAKKFGMIYIAPNGTVGTDGRRVWNAARSCCQRDQKKIDDIAYLNSLIDELSTKVRVDASRIYLVGHSNGAFLSITFACESGRIAGVISLAGAMDSDFQCTSKHPFNFLQIHGDADPTIKFNGGILNKFQYTSTTETIRKVGALNGCSINVDEDSSQVRIDFDSSIGGNETIVKKLENCKRPTQLWRIEGGVHSPHLPTNFASQIIAFLMQ